MAQSTPQNHPNLHRSISATIIIIIFRFEHQRMKKLDEATPQNGYVTSPGTSQNSKTFPFEWLNGITNFSQPIRCATAPHGCGGEEVVRNGEAISAIQHSRCNSTCCQGPRAASACIFYRILYLAFVLELETCEYRPSGINGEKKGAGKAVWRTLSKRKWWIPYYRTLDSHSSSLALPLTESSQKLQKIFKFFHLPNALRIRSGYIAIASAEMKFKLDLKWMGERCLSIQLRIGGGSAEWNFIPIFRANKCHWSGTSAISHRQSIRSGVSFIFVV